MYNSKDIRLKLLAGLIDTDGTVSREGTRISIVQGIVHEELAYQIDYLVRSLGFKSSAIVINTSWFWKGEKKNGEGVHIEISGDGVEEIPTLLPRKKCANPLRRNTCNTGPIKIKEVETSECICIEIDSNQRFLLEDFTVLHV